MSWEITVFHSCYPATTGSMVELARFKKIERSGVQLSVATDMSLDFALEIGETTQTVKVSESAPLVTILAAHR